ncbi:MAG: 5'-nucleotidase SurE [Candidatus Roizmanbacteria bacterium GW2011_GWA2_35_19]|uniref:5'-nucleotidase n=2 Tax=Candidatus Roizmaniibacteriota TaxID=1752723 RepID=A0A0G0E3H5_9BACT|nr:MAG: 5'-nucleotidase SurE [Candidatus Roizmanbacteria bacterium GW2011_GWC2_35_12]KKP69860.1 MAG: 5'-nucleotidase SurE [Candidatus Roizmanbacteria bacterium GW2011_GWA2_35_19]
MKNVFVVNDDSIRSPGLSVLIKNLEKYNLTVISTEHIRSWTSKAITVNKYVKLKKEFIDNHQAYVIDGFPADCVNIGLNHIVKEKPELLVSGINIGENATVGWLLSSATVAATIEGAICGVKGIAFSQQMSDEAYDKITNSVKNKQPVEKYEKFFNLSGKVSKIITDYVLERGFPAEAKIISVNFPPEGKFNGKWVVTRPYYWSYGSLFSKTPEGYLKTGGAFTENRVTEEGTDMWALHNGFISITFFDLPLIPINNKKVANYFSNLRLS